MRLTSYTDYALRVLMYLAVRPGRSARIAEIAGAYAISEAHLTKVVHHLAQTGDVASTRGRGGGLKLGRPASEINLGAVVRRIEPDLAIVECFRAANACVVSPACTLRGVLGEALAAFLAVLDKYTLADLVEPRQADLGALLGLDRPRESALPPG
jgi:Rrf2 family nitric oxide-sensitive transcriptional repressor